MPSPSLSSFWPYALLDAARAAPAEKYLIFLSHFDLRMWRLELMLLPVLSLLGIL
jgi:hypothetical protein